MLKVLVVDDEPGYRKHLKLLLAAEGYEVQTADDCATALGVAETFQPQVLIVDLMLKDRLTGLDIAQAMRGHVPDLKTIVISGHPGAEVTARASKIPFCAFFKKPFELGAMLEVVGEAHVLIPRSNAASRDRFDVGADVGADTPH